MQPCKASTLIFNIEWHDDYLALQARWFKGYNVNPADPESEAEIELIRAAARADWSFRRAEQNYAEVEALLCNNLPDLLMWNDNHHRALSRCLHYRTRKACAVAGLRKALEDHRAKKQCADPLRRQYSDGYSSGIL